jgi:hypothetical protein
MREAICPKCGSTYINYQMEQTGNIGVGQNRVTIQEPKKHHGLLYWVSCVWMFKLIYWMCIGWWWKLLFGWKSHGGLNLNANKTLRSTFAICQSCGHSWKV